MSPVSEGSIRSDGGNSLGNDPGTCRARAHTRSNAPTIYLICYRLIVQYVRTRFVLYKHSFLMREYAWSIRTVPSCTTRFVLYNHTFLMKEYAWTLRTGAHDDASH